MRCNQLQKAWVTAVLAWQFFTILPSVKVDRPTDTDMSRSALFLPFVGFILGLILVGSRAVLLLILPNAAANFLALVIYILCTGALHIDGLMDTFDAIGSRTQKEEALRIMKDSRVGAMGAIAAVVLLLGKWIAMTGEPSHILYPFILVPTLSRLAMLWSMVYSPPAKPDGLGRLFAGKLSPVYVTAISVVVFGVTAIFVPMLTTIVIFIVFYAVVMLLPRFFVRRFGGMTGDTFGALAELVEFVLFFAVLACVTHPLLR